MKSKHAPPASVDDYIAAFPRPVQTVLKRVRRTIRTAIPDAQESISYGIPAFKLKGHAAIYFAGWKEHYSLYPSNARLIAAFKNELADYEYNDKGTIRFPIDQPIPETLIAGIAQFRAKEVSGSIASRGRARSTRSREAGTPRPRSRRRA
jgi:uncharacterized protein YdhG (YjbR/CyaY superfamily)